MGKQFPQDYTPIEIQRFIDAAKEAAALHLEPLRVETDFDVVTEGERELDGVNARGYGIYSKYVSERYINVNIRIDVTGHTWTHREDGEIRVFRGSEPKD